MKLFLQLWIGADAYLMEASRVVRVLPLVEMKSIPRAPAGVVGTFNYRGTAVPVVDLNELTLGRPAAHYRSTRLILVPLEPEPAEGSGKHLLGVIAERVTDTVRCDPGNFMPAGVDGEASYLGPVVSHDGRLLQWVDVRKLLPQAVRVALFRDLGEAAA
ncbi:MAG TPA: chemotaxis protein CheW [Steroidobacteraceae bacterium]|nr:chemotaxis protein CheW [Steroidobacteraceae bacterium]